MLDYLGVPWVTAAGEAEAMCAYLDSQGLVDGCITNDGDAFLYGARTVYRNFNMNTKDPQVDCYRTSRVQTELHLSRENLVGLAVLLGCDYIPKGIPGVGKEQALKLIQTLKGQTLLQRFIQWKEENAGVSEGVVKKVPHCHVCRHPGSAKAHERGGCVLCDSKRFCQPQDFDYQCPCDWHRHEQTRQALSFEANIRKILKPRVRNAVACFEVIWNTPAHYVFPEDRPAEDQHEVRTVEEESLFRVAFPELVESYLRDKALAEENKTKKRKPKSKKEKPSEGCDNISDLLAQMTLQSSSSATATTQPQTLLHSISNTEEEVVVLDTPVNHKQHRKHKEDCSSLSDCPNTPVSRADSEADASPSVSAVIDALHLSDIDWDALSFTSSPPPPQTAPNNTAETKPRETADDDVNETGNNKLKTSSDIKRAESKAAPELCYTECSLRDRVLMRNTAKAMNQMDVNNDVVSKQLHYEVASQECVSSHSSNLKPNAQISIKDSDDSKSSEKESAVNKKEPLTDKGQCVTETHTSTQQLILAVQAQSKTKDCKKPPQKYKFVRNAVLSSAGPPQRCHSDPGHSNKDRNMHTQTTKKSVCMSVCSSSEDSDAENQQSGPQRRTKIKPVNKIKGSFLSDFPLKPVSQTSKPATAHSIKLLGPKPQRQSVDVKINSIPASTKSNCQDVPPAIVHSDVFLQTPASPVIVSDSDDSVICSESPLPLAERLRLKFLK
eukprot:superscaffoldBa00003883_g17890